MAKAQKEGVHLVSSEGTGAFYTYRKNKKKAKAGSKLSLMKYDPIARKHVLFEEKKMSPLKKKYKPGAVAKGAEPAAKEKGQEGAKEPKVKAKKEKKEKEKA
jgi:large subunit ribosomal protein L33